MLKWLRGSHRKTPPAAAPPAPAPAVVGPTADDLMRKAYAMHRAGDVAGAVALYREIVAIDPNYADAHYLLGCAEKDAGRPAEAIPHLRRALRSNNREAAFHRTLAAAYADLGLWEEAIAYLHNTVEREPADFRSWTNLGLACDRVGRSADAARHFERAVELQPDAPHALNNYGLSLRDRGRIEEAIPLLARAKDLLPDNADLLSNYLFALNYSDHLTREAVFREHLAFDARFGAGRPGGPRHHARPAAKARLRIGYFSPDLRAHPVRCFLEPVLAHHDHEAFEVVAYSLYPWPDAVSRRLQSLCDRWVDCAAESDDALAERIASDGVDILVDLAGHTGFNRLPVLGRKPAPVIATWLGYPNTTGLKTVDYRITDGVCDPPGMEALHTERLLRLDGAQWCFLAPDIPVEVTPLPASRGGPLCFGSFNHPSKLNDATLRLWAEVLRRVTDSTLLIWGIGDEQGAHALTVLRAAGVDPQRVETLGRVSILQQFQTYQRVDIALDTHPYSGVTTTFNSLWMGVPVLTLAGDHLAARSSSSILRALGMGEWTAESREEFIEHAVALATARDRLADLRRDLRPRLQGSALMDGPAFTRRLEHAYRRMWNDYIAAAGARP